MSKYRAARKENPLTPSQILLKDKQIINERPPSMTYAEYWFIRKHQTQLLKKLLRKPANQSILNLMR